MTITPKTLPWQRRGSSRLDFGAGPGSGALFSVPIASSPASLFQQRGDVLRSPGGVGLSLVFRDEVRQLLARGGAS